MTGCAAASDSGAKDVPSNTPTASAAAIAVPTKTRLFRDPVFNFVRMYSSFVPTRLPKGSYSTVPTG